jgi:hypothetical protein
VQEDLQLRIATNAVLEIPQYAKAEALTYLRVRVIREKALGSELSGRFRSVLNGRAAVDCR